MSEIITEVTHKKCRRCSEIAGHVVEVPITEFHKTKGGKHGVSSICKPCAVDEAKEWRENHPEKFKTIIAKSRIKRKEEIRVYNLVYVKENPEKIKATKSRFYQRHKERLKRERRERSKTPAGIASRKKYYQKKKERIDAERNIKRAEERALSPQPPEGTKRCVSCSGLAGIPVYHPLSEFYNSYSGAQGKGTRCKKSLLADAKARRLADPVAHKAKREKRGC